MCRGIGAIALQRSGNRLLFKSGINSHSDIRNAYGINDLRSEEQVNLEALPNGAFNDLSAWTINVDHDGEPPKWYVDDKEEIKSLFRDFFEGEIKEMVATKKYGGSLDLSGTGITSLPEGLSVGESLNLSGTGITSLPEGLSVGGSLDLSGTGITSLPEGLSVGGYLDLSGTGITSLPEGLSVGGSLDLSGTGITSLPEGLSVGGYLDLSGTGITSLPEGLSVGGYLYLSGTGITSLPERFKNKVIM